jgi:aryl-alcohol dehydrogenase-like predicted oxidoreductase
MGNSNDFSTFTLGHRAVNRLGYGAMQLAGPGVFGRRRAWGHADATRAGMAVATIAEILSIPGTSSLAHLRENLAAAELRLAPQTMTVLNAIGHVSV